MKRPTLMSLVLATVLATLLAWPVAATIRAGLTEQGTAMGGGLFDPAMSGSVGRPLGLAFETLRVVLGAEAIALPLGILLAVLCGRTDIRGRRLVLGVMTLAVFVPLPLHAAAWLGAFGNVGRTQLFDLPPLLVGWTGAAFVHAIAALPWVVLIVGLGLRTVDPALEEMALLERKATSVVLGVSLRRSLGSIGAAAVAVAVLTAGEMTVTDLVQVRTYAEEAYLQAQLGSGPASAARVALPPILVLGTLVAWAVDAFLRSEGTRRLGSSRPARTWRLGAWRAPLSVITLAAVGLLLALPSYGLAWRAGRVAAPGAAPGPLHWTASGFSGTLARAWPDLVSPSALALLPPHSPLGRILAWLLGSPLIATALWSTIAATLAATLAWALAWKARRSPGWRSVAVACVALTLATPGPVVGMGLKLAFLSIPWIHGTPAIVVLCYVVRTLPYALLVIWPAVIAIPDLLIETAQVEGFRPGQVALHVGLPLTRRAIAAGWAIAFVLATGELAASNLLLPPGVRTLTFQVWSLLHYGTESHLAGVGLILTAVYGAAGLAASAALLRWRPPPT